jgi:hypothetical protein
MIRCLFYRRNLSASVDAELELGPGLRRHLQDCLGCRRFYEQELSVARGLARTAGAERVPPPAFLQARILSCVRRGGRPVRPRPIWPRLAWAAGLAAALMVGFRAIRPRVAHQPGPTAPALARVQQGLAALERRLPDEKKLQRWSGTVEQPLDREMQALFHDARFAAQTLVNNFLPESPTQPSGGQDGTR